MTCEEDDGQLGIAAEDAHSNNSVAHKIIGKFVSELGKKEGLAEVAKALERVVYESPSEATLRSAMFGDEPI